MSLESFMFVIDNINRNMTRRHHTVQLQNNMFNGTMRAGIKTPIPTEAEVEALALLLDSTPDQLSIFPNKATFGAIREAFQVQAWEILTYLRRESFEKRTPTIQPLTEWRPMEVVANDSKIVDEMIKILDQLSVDGSIKVPTP